MQQIKQPDLHFFLTGDIYRAQRRPGSTQLLINQEYEGIALLDVWKAKLHRLGTNFFQRCETHSNISRIGMDKCSCRSFHLPRQREHKQRRTPGRAIEALRSGVLLREREEAKEMSRYAVFACLEYKVTLFLGKIVYTPSDNINFFHRRNAEARNWQRPELNRVLWKMLADHAGHPLRVVTEGTPEYNTLIEEDLILIGGDEPGHDISFEEYLKDWDG